MSTHEHGAKVPNALITTHKHAIGLLRMTSSALMSTHSTMGTYLWVFMRAPEYSWVLNKLSRALWSAPECSSLLMSAPVCSSGWFNNKLKCWLFQCLPCSILEISHSRSHQIIKNGIFLKSTQKGLLKNVQDGISRPLRSREIKKTRVETVLWDTL